MGVTGLWKLIEPCGKPVPVETLEGKILAVDISIWLHQVVKGFQDNKGSALNNAHLLGLFHRLCKLLYYRVRPVFVFDGCVPQLKRETIARRQQQRSKLNNEADRIQALLLQSLAKEKVVQQALGSNTDLILKSTKRGNTANRQDNDKDAMYMLPELTNVSKDGEESSDMNNSSFTQDCSNDLIGSTDDSSFEESNIRHAYYSNLQSIDVTSQHFKTLPAEVRHEILVDIKETRKQSSWGRLHELPSKKDDFSLFQMKRLLKRRAVQESLEEAQQDMAGVTLSYAELQNFFTEEGILDSDLIEKGSRQICSDEHTRFLLVRDLKKKLTKENEDSTIKEETEDHIQDTISEEIVNNEKLTKNSDMEKQEIQEIKKDIQIETKDILGREFDNDLEMAIALSLEKDHVYNEKDYDYESAKILKLNTQQKQELKNAATGPARAYMIEYGGMNDEEVGAIAEETILEPEQDDRIKEFLDSKLTLPEIEESEHISLHVSEDETRSDIEEMLEKPSSSGLGTLTSSKHNENSQEMVLKVSDESSTDSDSDFEEVPLENPKELVLVLNIDKNVPPEVDLFSDVFEDFKNGPKTNSQAEHDQLDFKGLTKSGETTPSDSNLAVHFGESEDIIEETPKIYEEKSMFEKYRSPLKKDGTTLLQSQPASETLNESEDNIFSILEELKKKKEEVLKMTANDISELEKPSAIVISDSDDNEEDKKLVTVDKNEFVEIFDSEDQRNQLISEANKSSNEKTPNKSIKEFFATDYMVKRTPDKPSEVETTPVKVASPYFVNRTPKSSKRKSDSSSPSIPSKKESKASKILFPDESTEDIQTKKQTEETEKINEIAKPSTDDLIKDMAETLKEQKSEEELKSLAEDLAQQRRQLENERNRQDRMGMSISQRMNSECQELLRLFGIPYIIAPMEAEAQCAFLDAMQLTNGTITDDSDIWLFGGRTVYKNFFAQNKHVLEFKAEQIEKSFNCDRKKLIQLACLVGSDYTPGIHGIGAVTAMEILASFSSSTKMIDENDAKQNHHFIVSNIIATLSKFRDWWIANKTSFLPPGSSSRLSLFKKLKNIDLYDGFPSMAVVEAYLAPEVDESKESFTWGYPDVESIKEFARRTFGWTTTKTNDLLAPVLKKLNDKKTQATIRNYFASKGVTNSGNRFHQMKVSKRIQNAIAKMTGELPNTPEQPTKAKRQRRAKTQTTENSLKTEASNEDSAQPSSSNAKVNKSRSKKKPSKSSNLAVPPAEKAPSSDISDTISSYQTVSEDLSEIPKKKARIPNTREIIPQRQRDLEQMERNKEKAAEILKESLKNRKRGKKN